MLFCNWIIFTEKQRDIDDKQGIVLTVMKELRVVLIYDKILRSNTNESQSVGNRRPIDNVPA